MKKPLDAGFSEPWRSEAEQARSKKFLRDLTGQPGFWPAQQDSNVRPTP